jgi:hypothetical protein
MLTKLFAGLALACLVTSPVFAADDCPDLGVGPLPADVLLSQAKATGDTIADDVSIKDADINRIIVDVDAKGTWIWFLKDGCVVAVPVLLGHAGASPVPAKPKLQGSGLEIGA